MNNRQNLIAAISYITWIGFIIAIVTGDRSDRFVAHHLNQALVIDIVSVVSGVLVVIPILGAMVAGVVNIAVFVFDIIGAINAFRGNMIELPFVSDIHLIG